jgi:peptidyl-dipeptidase A
MKKAVIVIILELIFGSLAFAQEIGVGASEQEFVSFLKNYEAKVIPLSKESALFGFEASISGKDADYEKSAQAQIELEKIYSDTTAFARLKLFRESGQITDPLLKRQLDILYRSFLSSQIDMKTIEELVRRQTAIGQKFYTYRTRVGERNLSDNEVDSILRYSTNSMELEETWKASKQVGREVAAELIELVKLRNRIAQSLGFGDYYEMQMKLGEQEPDEIALLFNQLDSLTGDAFAVIKREIDSALTIRYKVDKSQLRPWHYQNRFFQEAPTIYDVNLDMFYRDKDPIAISRTYFAGIGLPVDSILAHSDLYEREGKYQHAYCTGIDRSGDVRIVCNVRPDNTWMGTMLHELGHGVYDYYNNRQAPWLLRNSAHAFTTEAIAEFFGRLSGNPQWLKKVAGAPAVDVDKVAGDCAQMMRLHQLIFSRWTQVMVHFEHSLYENPDQNLNKLWWNLVEKYQGVACPDGRDEPDWASKIHIADAPVYYHNYLLGELLASQLAETIGRKVLNSSEPFNLDFANDPRIGKFLMDNVFQAGCRYSWNEMIERATGEKLTSVYYAKQFIGGK